MKMKRISGRIHEEAPSSMSDINIQNYLQTQLQFNPQNRAVREIEKEGEDTVDGRFEPPRMRDSQDIDSRLKVLSESHGHPGGYRKNLMASYDTSHLREELMSTKASVLSQPPQKKFVFDELQRRTDMLPRRNNEQFVPYARERDNCGFLLREGRREPCQPLIKQENFALADLDL